MNFNTWLKALDIQTVKVLGVSFHDLPDLTPIRDLYDDGFTPEEAFDVCAEEWAADSSLIAEILEDYL